MSPRWLFYGPCWSCRGKMLRSCLGRALPTLISGVMRCLPFRTLLPGLEPLASWLYLKDPVRCGTTRQSCSVFLGGEDAEDSGPRPSWSSSSCSSDRTTRLQRVATPDVAVPRLDAVRSPRDPQSLTVAIINLVVRPLCAFCTNNKQVPASVTATAFSAGPGECGSHSSPYLAHCSLFLN